MSLSTQLRCLFSSCVLSIRITNNILKYPPQTIGTNTPESVFHFSDLPFFKDDCYRHNSQEIHKKISRQLVSGYYGGRDHPTLHRTGQDRRTGSKFRHECEFLKCSQRYLAVCGSVRLSEITFRTNYNPFLANMESLPA